MLFDLGKISQRKVDVGDRVSKGDVLATLDTDDVNLQLDAARARFASARRTTSWPAPSWIVIRHCWSARSSAAPSTTR